MAVLDKKLNTAGVTATDAYLTGLQSVTDALAPVISRTIPVSTKVVENPMAKMIGPAREWVGARIARTVESTGHTITCKKYENTVEIKREDIEHDNLGVVQASFATLGQIAAVEYDIRLAAKLALGETDKCYDTKAFFASDHPENGTTASNLSGSGNPAWYVFDTSKALKPMVYVELDKLEFTHRWDPTDPRVFDSDVFTSGYRYMGAADFGLWQTAYKHKGTLDSSNFESVLTAMMSRVNDAGENMGIGSSYLVIVPPILATAAKKLFGRTYLANGEENINQGVPWRVWGRLSNT